MTSTSFMHEAGHSKQVHWIYSEGWDGDGGGRDSGTYAHLWLIHVNVWQKAPEYCKVISLQLNKYFKKEKIYMTVISYL